MAVTPTGIISAPLDALASLVASSTTFQAWVGAIDEAAAKPRAYPIAATGQGEFAFVRPFALIYFVPGFRIKRGGYGSGNLQILFEAAVNPDYAADGQDADAVFGFTNKVGDILKEMMVNSEASGRLFLPDNAFVLAAGPHRSGPKEADDYLQAAFNVQYGVH